LAGGDVLAAGGNDDVLDPVDDPQVGALDPLADVAGVQPALVVDGLGGRVGAVPVAQEGAGVPGQHLAGLLVQPQLDPGLGLPDGPDPYPARVVGRGHRGVLGHAVGLVDH